MKMLSKIAISFTMLILIMFGTGGICVAQCSCTGKTTLMLPIERGCCPMESDCMTITVAHISDYEAPTFDDTLPSPPTSPSASIRLFNSHRFHGFHGLFHLTANILHINPIARGGTQAPVEPGTGAPNDPTSIVGTIVLRI